MVVLAATEDLHYALLDARRCSGLADPEQSQAEEVVPKDGLRLPLTLKTALKGVLQQELNLDKVVRFG